MRFLIYVEGRTEHNGVGRFLKKWLDPPRLTKPVRVEPIQYQGFGDYLSKTATRVPRDLDKPGADVIAAIGLLDIYQLEMPFPKSALTVADRVLWAKQEIEANVNHPRFRQFFAVHEIEAWLLSDPTIFPSEVRAGLSRKTKEPEKVNLHEPPSKLLERLYRTNTGKGYRKAIHGASLFSSLDPETAYYACPNLKALLDEMLRLAQEAGL